MNTDKQKNMYASLNHANLVDQEGQVPDLIETIADEAVARGQRRAKFAASAVGVVLGLVAFVAVISFAGAGASAQNNAHVKLNQVMQASSGDQSTTPNAWVSFEGGGFCAQTSYTGFITGMMAVTGVDTTALMKPFAGLSSNSGGSWFSASMIYSEKYNDIVNQMVARPADSAKIFENEWVKPIVALHPLGSEGIPETTRNTLAFCYYMIMGGIAQAESLPLKKVFRKADEEAWNYEMEQLGIAKRKMAKQGMKECKRHKQGCKQKAETEIKEALPPRSEMVKKMVKMAQASGLPFASDLALLLGFMEDGGDSWENMVATMLDKAAGISLDVTLGSPPMAWAKGKTWHAATSIPTSQQTQTDARHVYALQDPLDPYDTYVSYNVSSAQLGGKFPLYTPAKFTYLLGSDQDDLSESFCGKEDCFEFKRNYRGKTGGREFAATSPSLGDQFKAALQTKGRMLPVARVAASSSAAIGGADQNELSAAGSSQCYQLSSWVSSAPDGKAYEGAIADRKNAFKDRSVNQKTVQQMADSGYGSLIDGGYTDNLGLAWAISSGTKLVTVLMNGDSIGNLWQLFGAPDWGVAPFLQVSNDIFTMSYQEAEKQWTTFPSLAVPSGSSAYLNKITYGAIKTTTKENKWFNVSGGTDVTLNLILVNSTGVAMMIGDNYNVYAEFVGEIVSTMTMPENKAAVDGILKDYFYQIPANERKD